MEQWQLKQLKSLPLHVKILKSQQRIKEWYEYYNGEVYVSFSGGKDSTVLLHLARSVYPDIKAVFCDTGLEFPEIKEFVKSIDNVEIIRPEISFRNVLDKHGYPIISKEVAEAVGGARKGQKSMIEKLTNEERKFNCTKYKYLLDAPFKISAQCCNEMKKKPFKKYEKTTGLKPIVGTMASESQQRQKAWLKYGCNAFESKRPMSKPISFWDEEDIWAYIRQENVEYSDIYNKGYKRTGCIFCMFGVHLEKYPNRFQNLEYTHPQLHDYCINNLGLKDVLEYLNIEYKDNQTRMA